MGKGMGGNKSLKAAENLISIFNSLSIKYTQSTRHGSRLDQR